jgi:hypothetical protein
LARDRLASEARDEQLDVPRLPLQVQEPWGVPKRQVLPAARVWQQLLVES